ncbi:MAG TPA: CYTH domain-containing protein, partial [Gemmatimonadales bacterium]|nr:CYTH domain-containing protein [Gemmatimonadales bacterium]
MRQPTVPQAKWDVASGARLRELIAEPSPLGLRAGPPIRTFFRDIYYDTPDGSLTRREITCRFRIGADDRRRLRLTIPGQPVPDRPAPRERYEAVVPELDLAAALGGASEPARRLRGLVEPASLEPMAEIEIERTTRRLRGLLPWSARFELVYDFATVRQGGLQREFHELKARRLGGIGTSIDELAAALAARPGLRQLTETKLARAQRLAAGLEAEALARSIAGGRLVSVVALAAGSIALVADGDRLRLPITEGQGEAACRHLLQTTFGSSVGDVALLGTAPPRNGGRPQEVWLVRRLRLDTELPASIVWLGTDEVVSRVGGPSLNDPDTIAGLDVAIRSQLLLDAEAPTTARRERTSAEIARPRPESGMVLSGDLSILEFQERVLALAEDEATPLLERLNFLAIVSSNVDEFFMVNVGALQAEGAGRRREGILEAIGLRVRALTRRQQRVLFRCLEELADAGVRVRRWADLTEEARSALQAQFRREIFPLITPRAITVSPGFPSPVMPQLSVLLAVLLQDDETGPTHIAYLRLPDRLPRFLPVPGSPDRIPIEEVVRANLGPLYPQREIEGAWLFRLTRAADLELEDADAGDLLQAIEESVQRRALNPVVRVEIEREMPRALRERLLWELRFERGGEAPSLGENEIVDVDGMLDLRALRELAALPMPERHYPAFEGRDPWTAAPDLWAMLRERDVLAYHPVESFAATTVRFFADASADPTVLAIRLTL